MEENTQENVEITNQEESKEEIETLRPSGNRSHYYVPTEFQLIDYQNSWKKCKCGRQTWLNDNWCPACGQRLGMPIIEDEQKGV